MVQYIRQCYLTRRVGLKSHFLVKRQSIFLKSENQTRSNCGRGPRIIMEGVKIKLAGCADEEWKVVERAVVGS